MIHSTLTLFSGRINLKRKDRHIVSIGKTVWMVVWAEFEILFDSLLLADSRSPGKIFQRQLLRNKEDKCGNSVRLHVLVMGLF